MILLRNWNFSRFLRLGIGVLVAVQAYQVEQWWFMAFGVFRKTIFTLQASKIDH